MVEISVDKVQNVDRIELGKIEVEPEAQSAVAKTEMSIASLLARHAKGDWGNIGEHAKQLNQYAVQHGWRVQSTYVLNPVQSIRIRTNPGRTKTEVVLVE